MLTKNAALATSKMIQEAFIDSKARIETTIEDINEMKKYAAKKTGGTSNHLYDELVFEDINQAINCLTRLISFFDKSKVI